MSEQKPIDVSDVQLESPTFPTAEDQAIWDSLSPAEQHALISRELDAAEKSGPAQTSSMKDMIARVRGKKT